MRFQSQLRKMFTTGGLALMTMAMACGGDPMDEADALASPGSELTSSGASPAPDATSLQAMATVLNEMQGAARDAGTTGGKSGQIYRVTSLLDDPVSPKPGTLRHALLGSNRWIRFDVSGTIMLRGNLYIKGNNVTIDGRGAQIKLDHGEAANRDGGACKKVTAYSLIAEKVDNIVILNLTLSGRYLSTTSECSGADLFSILGSDRIWIHHVTFLNATEHAIEMRSNADSKSLQDDPSDGVTVSYSRFSKVAAANFRTLANGTFHHNFCDGPHQSCPRVGFNCNASLADGTDRGCKDWAPVSWEARLHIYNNYYRDWPTMKLIVTNDVMQDDNPNYPSRPKEVFLLSQYDMFEARTKVVATADSQWSGNNLRVEDYNDSFGLPITLPDMSTEKTMPVSRTSVVERPASTSQWQVLAQKVKTRAGAIP